jgi:tetratricopeptide (TPR) repeat protein
MQTKLTRYADGLIEAVWLAAVIIVPVFFNIYSSRIFEPDKISILRSLTLIGLGAWVVKTAASGGIDWGRLQASSGSERVRSLLKIPLIPAVFGLAAAYLISTIFSVTPRVSLLGSYQRLQGAYTMFSYFVIFGMVAVNMRRKAQVERLITTAILTSLPIGLYGILQRFQIDPLPWGADTSERVAANLGNSIFVAAYLIMAFPLALGRIVEAFSHILDESQTDLGPHIARGTVYVFTAAIQLIGIYFSVSRGPILGLLAGTFFLVVLLSLYWGKRWLTLTTVGAATALGIFLVVFSIPGGPLESLRSSGTIGRLGNVFETEAGTGRVRVLIWQGAAELVAYGDPIEFPDGTRDRWNFLRPFIGYGPESMYVVYNSVYPPELANIEQRNASPDRSHNETWDALVITGIIGLAAEQVLFVSVFYYGLKWLGLLNDARQRRLFLGLIIAGGLFSSLGFVFLIDIGFLGVGLPFGMLLGLLAYLTLTSVFSAYQRPETPGERTRALTLMMFLGAIIAHYVEVHFGIAISATRLYFWVYCGVILAVGFWMTHGGRYGQQAQTVLRAGIRPGWLAEPVDGPTGTPASGRKSRRRGGEPFWRQHAWIGGLTGGIFLATLSFDYFTNSSRLISIAGILRESLTILPQVDGQVASYGILALFVTSWLAWSVVFASEWARREPGEWRPVMITTGLLSLVIWFVFSTFHAGRLVAVIQAATAGVGDPTTLDAVIRQSATLEGMLTQFYVAVLVLVLLAGRQLSGPPEEYRRLPGSDGSGFAIAAVVGVLALAGAWQFNLRVIHADIAFKVADPFTRSDNANSWQVALDLFKRSNRLAPQEDHYYLFLGKAYLEFTRLLRDQSPFEVQELLTQAESDLKRAQRINPLNTDHTANLARLYRFWAGIPGLVDNPGELLIESSDFYSRALVLSPNNAVLWNEWALLYLQELGDPERGLELLMHSMDIDPFYAGTYGILGDYHAAQARAAVDDADRLAAAGKAAEYYAGALERTRRPATMYLYAVAMGGIREFAGDLPAAIDAYLIALENSAENQVWLVADTLAKVYARAEDFQAALEYAALSLEAAPDEQKPVQLQLIETITGMQADP